MNCSLEETITINNSSNEELRPRLITYDELQGMPRAMEKLNAIAVQKNKRLAYSKKYDFAIDTDKILLVEKGAYLSLSFPVYRDSVNGYMENLFLHPHRGRYIAFLVRYKFSPADMENLDGGKPIADIVTKMSFVPLEDFDVENPGIVYTQGASGGGYSGTYWLIDGICHTWHHYTPEGEADYWAPIACPNCEGCPSANSSDPGSHNPDGLYPLYYALVDLSPGSGGGGTPNGGGSGTGGQNPGTGFTTPFNPVKYEDADPLELQTPGLYNPHPIVGVVSPNKPTPCEMLNALKNDAVIKTSLNVLNDNLGSIDESLFTFRKNGSGGSSAAPQINSSGASASMRMNSATYGVAHTHQSGPTSNSGLYKMFSFTDVARVYDFAKGYAFSQTVPVSMFFNMMVIKDNETTVSEAYTYIVFPNDVEEFKNMGDLFSESKIEAFNKKLNFIYDKNCNENNVNPLTINHQTLAPYFLKFVNNLGNNSKLKGGVNFNLSLYRIKSDNNFSGKWEKLELDPNNNYQLKITPCN